MSIVRSEPKNSRWALDAVRPRLHLSRHERLLRRSPELRFYLPPQLRHLRRLHPILRQHEQLTLLSPDMVLEQNAETVHLIVRAGLDGRGFSPKLEVVAKKYVDQRRFRSEHRAECGKQQVLFEL